ncbi:MAG: alpha/beta hydrolase [Hyphomicrobium sp.]
MSQTIVMIHGAFAGAWCFDNFSDAFRARGWTCHAPDLRYHGVGPIPDPDPHLANTSIRDYTDDMAAFIAGLDEVPIIIGHSMGGLVAQQLAAKGLARGLVLLTAGAPWGILPSTSDEMAVAIGLMAAGPFWTKSMQPMFEVAADNSLDKLDPISQRRVFDKLGPESGRALFELFFWMFDVRCAIAVDSTKVNCPVLVISGSDDKVISAATGRRVAQLYGSNATFHEAQGHGHFLLLEPGWERLAECCADWITLQSARS